jgi:lycopene cyclase domain-containing protein
MEYTLSVLISTVLLVLVDWWSGIRLLSRKVFWVFLAIMYGFMIPVNGYLTSRPIVIYAPEHNLGIRVFSMPIEDFLFGFSVMVTTLLLWQWFTRGKQPSEF